ncbi:flagellar hook protein FlgE [Pseudothermotoga thermarum]|uniref:Flagellar hook protein FlgE n=1 Tax=Pseudothermotoga thermarum DSM 5069 TaxID=688269 RepID=F7YW66_9THEM|nr:flagellar hook-basal body complex protein [Pseudothermotoga thermarum]AEH51838.1 flagellar hook-basal body protein [Pseudothermotoga thermarum DSM 5069]
MMRSMFSGVSGMRNFQYALDVVSNNISNVNTVGFKGSRVTFQTALSQTLKAARSPQNNVGGTNPIQIGLGSQLATVDKIMTQGSFENTGRTLDLAIQGDGFFVISNGTQYFYTRSGAFDVDTNGTLIHSSTGLKVQGWRAVQDPTTGKRYVDTNQPIGDIVIGAGLTMPARATTAAALAGNLQSNVGPLPFSMTVTDSSTNTNYTVRFTFEKTSADFVRQNGPFGSTQSYTWELRNEQNQLTEVGFIEFNEFGRVVRSGTAFKVTPASAGQIDEGDFTSSFEDGNYYVIIKNSDGEIIYEGLTTVTGGNFTISDPDILNTEEYFVIFGNESAGDEITIAGDATISIPTAGEPRFYESDNPSNMTVLQYQSPKYITSVQVYDSLGNPYTLYLELTRIGQFGDMKNAWLWRAYTASGEPITYIDASNNTGYVGGIINFNESGRLQSLYGVKWDGSNLTLGNVELRTIQFNANHMGDSVVTINLDFTALTQFAGSSSASFVYQNGNPLGYLQSFAINENGEIIGTFSNGLTDILGQVALAIFNNPAGLTEVGNSLYTVSANSGLHLIGAAGTGGRGTLIPGALEMSNVDLAEEFARMIIAQRGFQANARVITTADTILGEVVALRR